MDFLERQPDAWPRLVEVLCGRLRASDLQMAELAMQPLPVRLAKVLLRMAHSESPLSPPGPGLVAFDVLVADGQDVRAAPLKERQAMFDKITRRYGMQCSEPVLG